MAMDADGLLATIGNTPLIRLRRASELTGCEILSACRGEFPLSTYAGLIGARA